MEEWAAGQDRKRLLLGGAILVGSCFALIAMVGRLAHINTTLRPRLLAIADAQQTAVQRIPARRGFIFDTTGRILAGSWEKPSVFADPRLIEDVDSACEQLARILDSPAEELAAIIRRRADGRFCWLARRIEQVDADSIVGLKIPGIVVQREKHRSYPMESLMSPVLGVVGRDGEGLEGLEFQYERQLAGVDGRQAAVHDGGRQRDPIWSRGEMSRAPRDGGHIVLTLDAVVQGMLESELESAAATYEAKAVVGVVMSPRSGAVLAMGQYPTFDPNRYDESPTERRRNRAICDAIEPGSIFKPFVAVEALLNGAVTRDEEIDCGQGVHAFGGRVMHDVSNHGLMTLSGIIGRSSNIGMGIIAERMGNAAIAGVVGRFGFGVRTGVAFPGEAAGIVLPLHRWTSYSTTSVPIGQEIATTPIQLLTAFCAIVNGGTLFKPYLVRSLLSSDGDVVRSQEQGEVVRQVIPAELANYMRDKILVGVVRDGGGFRAAMRNWVMAGKTGTAQVPYSDRRGYEPLAYVGSFLGAAPAADPEVAVLIMVHRPNAAIAYYGGQVAAPVAGKVMEKTLAYLQVPIDLTANTPPESADTIHSPP